MLKRGLLHELFHLFGVQVFLLTQSLRLDGPSRDSVFDGEALGAFHAPIRVALEGLHGPVA
jgi:hypothetical protein